METNILTSFPGKILRFATFLALPIWAIEGRYGLHERGGLIGLLFHPSFQTPPITVQFRFDQSSESHSASLPVLPSWALIIGLVRGKETSSKAAYLRSQH